jgi:hypothetical protein
MSRSRRIATVSADSQEVWSVVDAWAVDAVDPIALRARWSARATPVRGLDHFVDVLGEKEDARAALNAAGVRARAIRPDRRALGRTGTAAYPDTEAVIAALTDESVPHRIVTAGRRYVWRGPMTGPTYCEISVGGDEDPAIMEAWHQPAWTDSLRPHRGDGDPRLRPPQRVEQARASINRLLAELGAEPIRTT